jgi:CRISPR system Cascade subunit CasD
MNTLGIVLQAPLMSFGSVAVDESVRPTARFPTKSMVVGLLANVLGYSRNEPKAIARLQSSIEIASRIDRLETDSLTDYQTAILANAGSDAQSFVVESMWSSRGTLMGRGKSGFGGKEGGTVQIFKKYLQDGSFTVAVSSDDPALFGEIVEAVQRPARPVFLGRKGCLPSREIFECVVEADDVLDALLKVPVREEGVPSLVQWPSHLGDRLPNALLETIHDVKNWASNAHVGTRRVYVAEHKNWVSK